jgi:uridine phosphorylase
MKGDALPTLPEHPNLGQLRRQAKDLLRAATADDTEALKRIRRVSDRVNLASAQLAVAREHGFPSWVTLKNAVDGVAAPAVEPLLSGKHRQDAIYKSADFIGWAHSQGWDPGPLPAGMVFTSSTHLTRYLTGHPECFELSTTLTPANGQVFVTVEEPLVAIACLGVGAPGVATEVEHLVHLGVKRFIAVGPAPAVSMEVQQGDCVIVDKALRDDGVSQHYLEPARYAFPDPDLSQHLFDVATDRKLNPVRGPTWTVPTPYRTTTTELEMFRAEGVLTTELSTAALLAVATSLGASAASAVIVTRNLGTPYVPRRPDSPSDATLRLLEAAIDTIQAEENTS